MKQKAFSNVYDGLLLKQTRSKTVVDSPHLKVKE